MTIVDICPVNGCDLRGDPIDPEYADYYAEGARYYSKMIGVEVQGVYDGVLYWTCSTCGVSWPRFDAPHRLHYEALKYVGVACRCP